MLILSNSLTQMADEGSLKLASSLVKRIKAGDTSSRVVTFERECSFSDHHLLLNKFHVSRELAHLIRETRQPLLYIPFPAPSLSMALRIWLLSLLSKRGMQVLMIRQFPMNWMARCLLRMSGARLVVFSEQAREYYRPIVGGKVDYLKSGVDTEKFRPVTDKQTKELKTQYGFDPDRPLVLHVGHMKEGRGIAELMKIDRKYQVLLVVSTLSKQRQSEELKERLLRCENIRIMGEYIPNIEEIYQMSDVYFFPVKQAGHCIDVPLSCLEAAACNKPVITTDYGEMKAFRGKAGFHFIDEIEESELNRMLADALAEDSIHTRQSVLQYDWSNCLGRLLGRNQ